MKFATFPIFLLWTNLFFLFSIKKVTAFPAELDNADVKDKEDILDNVEVVQVKGEPIAKIVEAKQSDSKADKSVAAAVDPSVIDSDDKTESQVQVSPLQTAKHKKGNLNKKDHKRVTSNTTGQKSTNKKVKKETVKGEKESAAAKVIKVHKDDISQTAEHQKGHLHKKDMHMKKGHKRVMSNTKGQKATNKKVKGQNLTNKKVKGQNLTNKKVKGQKSTNKKLKKKTVKGQKKSAAAEVTKVKAHKDANSQTTEQKKGQLHKKGHKDVTSNTKGQKATNKKVKGKKSTNKKVKGENVTNKKVKGQNLTNKKVKGQNVTNKKVKGQKSTNKKLKKKTVKSQKKSAAAEVTKVKVQKNTNSQTAEHKKGQLDKKAHKDLTSNTKGKKLTNKKVKKETVKGEKKSAAAEIIKVHKDANSLKKANQPSVNIGVKQTQEKVSKIKVEKSVPAALPAKPDNAVDFQGQKSTPTGITVESTDAETKASDVAISHTSGSVEAVKAGDTEVDAKLPIELDV